MLNSQQCTLMTETLSRHGLVQCIYVYNIYVDKYYFLHWIRHLLSNYTKYTGKAIWIDRVTMYSKQYWFRL